jgi:phenylacetate-coenzyme A ligase PaaK-like adenylate-forming protein
MLLMSESIILEVLDDSGQPVPPGGLGEAVMTGLCSQAQPFIRYRTGDMVRLARCFPPAAGDCTPSPKSPVAPATSSFAPMARSCMPWP